LAIFTSEHAQAYNIRRLWWNFTRPGLHTATISGQDTRPWHRRVEVV